MSLLERESPLASLVEYAGQAHRGEGRLVLISGEAGVGKSALVEALAERLAEDGPAARWSWGACDGLFTPRPLGPLFDVAGQLGGELLRLSQIQASRHELFAALLGAVNEPGTLHVLVVEDVHWADEATVDLLLFLGRRLRHASVLVLATYRDDALTMGDPLRIALGQLATQRSTRRIGLAPLSPAAVGVLAGDCGLAPAELYRLTGGNPFYVSEVVQAGAGAMPPSARDAVLARTTRLGPQARAVLDTAALMGTRIDPPLLSAAAGASPSVLDELVDSGLLVDDAAGLRFRHEIARLAVEQAVAPHRRPELHGRILSALVGSGSDDDAGLAFHAECARDAAAVVHHALRAALRSSDLASHREAAAQYERALRFAQDAEPLVLATVYEGYAREASLIDRWEAAAEAHERALVLWRLAGEPRRAGDTQLRLSRALWRLCRGAEAMRAARAALTTLEPLGPGVELASAYGNLASQLMSAGDNEPAIELARRAGAMAEGCGALDIVSDALNTEACATACLGREWTALMHRALEIATTGRLLSSAGRAYANLYSTLCAEYRFADAEPYYVEGLAFCEANDVATYATCMRGERARMLESTGRWDEGASLSAEQLERQGPSPINRINPLLALGVIRIRRGDPAGRECLDEAMRAAEGTGEAQWIVATRLALIEADFLEGRPAAARAAAELAVRESAGADARMRGEALTWLKRTAGELPDWAVVGDVAVPYRHQLEGDGEEAARVWVEFGCAYAAGLALFDAGRDDLLRQALEIFDGLGAVAMARVTRRRMRGLGLRSIPRGAREVTRAHPVGLTRRERDVLNLICSGHTNAEIGSRLFISAKTVDHHVSAVLTKLGVSTRAVAAAEAVRLGLVATGGSAAPTK